METKLYVGNLSYNTNEPMLEQLFGEAGVVKSVQIIKDRDSGRSKGFGFVEMSSRKRLRKRLACSMARK